jgi:hypothetical protein
MKYMTLFLLATLAHADLQIRQITSEQTGDGFIVKYVENGVIYCWGMPDVLDRTFIPQTWTPVTQAAIDYRWPVMTGDDAMACLNGPPVPRVVEMNEGELPVMFGISGQRLTRIGTVPAGTPCGDVVSQYYSTPFYYRAVTHAGIRGMALCY